MKRTTNAKEYGVDWEEFGEYSRPLCYCRCGAAFAAYHKIKFIDGDTVQIYERECPICKTVDDVYRVSHDYESYSISSDDVGEL